MGNCQRLLPFPCYLGPSTEHVLKFLFNLFFFLYFCSLPMRAIWCDQHVASLHTILVPSCHLTCFPFNFAHGYRRIAESIIYTLSLVCEICLLGTNSSRVYLRYLVRWVIHGKCFERCLEKRPKLATWLQNLAALHLDMLEYVVARYHAQSHQKQGWCYCVWGGRFESCLLWMLLSWYHIRHV